MDVFVIWQEVSNHQLDALIDRLPKECAVKDDLQQVSILEGCATTYRYPTPSGRIPDAPRQQDVEAWLEHMALPGAGGEDGW